MSANKSTISSRLNNNYIQCIQNYFMCAYHTHTHTHTHKMPSQINTEMNCWARSIFQCRQVHWIIPIKLNEMELEQKCMDFNHNGNRPDTIRCCISCPFIHWLNLNGHKQTRKKLQRLPALFHTDLWPSSIEINLSQSKWHVHQAQVYINWRLILNAFVRLITCLLKAMVIFPWPYQMKIGRKKKQSATFTSVAIQMKTKTTHKMPIPLSDKLNLMQ